MLAELQALGPVNHVSVSSSCLSSFSPAHLDSPSTCRARRVPAELLQGVMGGLDPMAGSRHLERTTEFAQKRSEMNLGKMRRGGGRCLDPPGECQSPVTTGVPGECKPLMPLLHPPSSPPPPPRLR